MKKGDLILINYPKLQENIYEVIGNDKILKKVMNGQIHEMERYDIENGIKRTIIEIHYIDFLDKKIPKYDLDNGFTYFENEIIKL